jgi:outer membrane protein assembly factor BamD (BamD/ComL family)
MTGLITSRHTLSTGSPSLRGYAPLKVGEGVKKMNKKEIIEWNNERDKLIEEGVEKLIKDDIERRKEYLNDMISDYVYKPSFEIISIHMNTIQYLEKTLEAIQKYINQKGE